MIPTPHLIFQWETRYPWIERIESVEFSYDLEDVGTSPSGFDIVYAPDETYERKLFDTKVHTDAGITGEYIGSNSSNTAQINMIADYLVGKNSFKREKHWSELKRALRKYDRMGVGPLDIAL